MLSSSSSGTTSAAAAAAAHIDEDVDLTTTTTTPPSVVTTKTVAGGGDAMTTTAAPTHVPILQPPQDIAPPRTPPALSAEQQQMLDDLRARLPDIFASLTGDPLPGERDWANDSCLRRYLRAVRHSSIDDAAQRLTATLQWRREYRPSEIPADEVEPEAVTGKQFFSGFDIHGRPCYYLVPRLQNTKTYDRQLRYVVFNLEKGVALMGPNVEQFSLIIDYEGISMMNSTPIHVSRRFLDIVSSHYPERLGLGIMINPSWYLWAFFKLLGPFLDPVTKAKIHFVSLSKQKDVQDTNTDGTGGWTNILHYIRPDQLPIAYGGTHPFTYSHETYWKHFTAIENK